MSLCLRRLLVCGVLLACQLLVPLARAQTAHCEDDTTAEVMLGGASAGVGPASCTTEISCPKVNRGPCRVEAEVDIAGIGLVAAEVAIGKAEPATCSDPGGCSATTQATLRPGRTARIECSMTSPTVATSVTLTCSAAAS